MGETAGDQRAGDPQAEVFAFLERPQTHGGAPVTRIDTHAACVFLAGDHAYKVKRAVRFPFLDFSTLEKRRAACAAELEVNRANAPALYLGLIPITRTAQGLALGGTGAVVEWAVEMRRFDETQTLDRLGPHALDDPLLSALATRILESHARAPQRPEADWTDAFVREARATLAALQRAPDILPDAASYGAVLEALLGACGPLLRQRGAAGAVRRCHGDLHLRNIALVDGAPLLFDAIEFNPALATCDVLYDLAFLLMDFWHRGQQGPANRVMNRYLWGTPDFAAALEGLGALPLFISLRAAIRAKVALDLAQVRPQEADQAQAEARAYLSTARAALLPSGPPLLVGIGGLSGTGKSSLAARIAPCVGGMPGALHLRSDIERKRLLGRAELDRLPPEAYGADITRQTYDRLHEGAAGALRAGRSVVVDAVQARPEERAALVAVARGLGARFVGLWLDAPLDLLRTRVAERRSDASDATVAVVERQADFDLGALDWHRLEASLPLGALETAAATLLKQETDREPG